MNRKEAFDYLKTKVSSESLIKHSLAVEAGMRGYAKLFGEDIEYWGICGLLHDIDFQEHPDEHPLVGVKWLGEKGFDDHFLNAIKGHASYTNTPRTTKLSKTLYAVDELSSFVIAVALVRPDKFKDLGSKSVRKKLKDKAFARAVDREEVAAGAEELEIEFNEHIDFVIQSIAARELELNEMGLTLL